MLHITPTTDGFGKRRTNQPTDGPRPTDQQTHKPTNQQTNKQLTYRTKTQKQNRKQHQTQTKTQNLKKQNNKGFLKK